MGFAGRFELSVPDILQILSLGKKTGKLRLSRLGNTGEILFKNGKVIYATCDSTRSTLGQLLISQKHLTEDDLMAALELQHLSTDSKKRLGAILIEKGIITPEVLQQAIRHQVEQVILEILSWDNGFFRFDMMEITTDDEITVELSAFLPKTGISPEILLLEGVVRLDERQKSIKRTPPVPPATPASTSHVPVASHLDSRQKVETPPRPEPLDSARGKPVEGPRPPPARPSPEVLADLIEGQWEGERPPWIKSEASPDPTPGVRIEERGQVETPPRPEPLDSARGKHVEGPRPPSPKPPARPERVEGPRPAPDVPLRPAPAVPRPERVEGPAAEIPPPTIPARPERFDVAHRPEPVEGLVEGPPREQSVPAPVAPSGRSPEGPLLDLEPSRITDEIMLSSPIAPWVLIMHLAADVVSRGVLLFVRSDGITGHDQFGVGGGRDSGDERIINIKLPLREPSIFAAATHARTTYRGKIGPGKWNDYFLNQLGGKRPDEAVIIPIIVAGKVVAIFYGDDAGSGTPLGDVERLQTLVGQTFSAVEASILEKRGRAPA